MNVVSECYDGLRFRFLLQPGLGVYVDPSLDPSHELRYEKVKIRGNAISFNSTISACSRGHGFQQDLESKVNPKPRTLKPGCRLDSQNWEFEDHCDAKSINPGLFSFSRTQLQPL